MAPKCCNAFCWSATCSVLLVLLAAGALASPWYYSASTLNVLGIECTTATFISWRDTYCTTSGTCSDSVKDNCSSRRSWTSDSGVSAQKKLFDTTLGLLVSSVFFAVVVCVVSFYRCCHNNKRQRNKVEIVANILGLSMIIVTIVYFAIQAPKSFKEDNRVCITEGTKSPCTDLFGSVEYNLGFAAAKTVWGPAGWFLACGAFLLYLATFGCAFIQDTNYGEQVAAGIQFQPVASAANIQAAA